jgi:glycosyltransferase involved in cell wall biosynthesis
MQPLISVIIPVYNGARFLPEAIANVFAQAYDPIEIIVVDDGSTDNTSDVASQYGDRIRYYYQPNQGPAAARNYGLSLALGEFIAFLDVDDQWPANKLQHHLVAFAKNPELAIVNGYVQLMQAVAYRENTFTFEERSVPVVSFNLGSALFRRSVFEQVGVFDANQIHSEDVDWFMRAREMEIPMVILEEVTLLYRKHDQNLTHDRQENLRGFLSALRKSIHRRQQVSLTPESLSSLTYLDAEGKLYQKDQQAPAILNSQGNSGRSQEGVL